MKHSIVWSLDPFDKSGPRLSAVAKAIRLWRAGGSARVFPFSVLTPYDLGWSPDLKPVLQERMATVGRQKLQKIANQLKLTGVERPYVKVERSASKRSSASSVVRYAQDHEAGVIVAGTHGRRGFQRARVGSFAESLISISNVPVMVVHEKSEIPQKVRTILFPYEMTVESKKALRRTVEVAKRFGARLVLYHFQNVDDIAFTYWEGANPDLVARALVEAQSKTREEGRKVANGICRLGVDCEFVLDRRAIPLGPAILRAGKSSNADLIVLTTSRGTFRQALFGGTLRDVISQSKRPVLVMHGS